jgi:hypothetical protein
LCVLNQRLKKFASIFLIFLLLFNWVGYRLVLSVMQEHADQKLESRIDDNEYDESQLIEIRVALNMPYQERFTDFERHYGEVKIDGKVYRYVKRKIEGDILILKCIPNNTKQQLIKTADELAKSSSGQDQDSPGKKQSHSFAKVFSGDYDDQNLFCSLCGADRFLNIITLNYSSALKDILIKTPHQPPRV